MFLHLSVILFTGGVSVQGVSVQGDPQTTIQLGAGSTHPTGMHSGSPPPPYTEVQAVGILQECILVLLIFDAQCEQHTKFSYIPYVCHSFIRFGKCVSH